MKVRRAMTGSLVLWCILGAAATAGGLTDPSAWGTGDAASESVIGIPLRGAAETAAIRALLPDGAGRSERWLVLFPPGSDELVLMYVRYQLAHVEYPRRVDVLAAGAYPDGVHYHGVIAAPGIVLPLPWRIAAAYRGFTRHEAVGT